MKDKRRYFMDELDHLRYMLTREPRGHQDMLAAVVTEPVGTLMQTADLVMIKGVMRTLTP